MSSLTSQAQENLSEDQMNKLLGFVADKTGMVFASRLNGWVTKQFFQVLKDHNAGSTENFLRSLVSNFRAKEAQNLFDKLTVNETMFFRDKKYFHFIEKTLIPALMEKNSANRSITIWIAAGSSGQEIYSILFKILEKFPELEKWNLKLYSSDICTEVIEKSKNGVYEEHEVSRGLDNYHLDKYFQKTPEGKWQVKAQYRSKVKFMHSNLVEDFSRLVPRVDFISCRNVLIYFDEQTKRDIVDRLCKQVSDGGFLLLGQVDYISLKKYPEGIEYLIEEVFPYLKRT